MTYGTTVSSSMAGALDTGLCLLLERDSRWFGSRRWELRVWISGGGGMTTHKPLW